MLRLTVLLLVACLCGGCVFTHTDSATMVGLGKVTAEHNCEVEVPDPEAEGCTRIEGQGLTEGFVKFLSDALTVIPRMLAGAAGAAITTQ